MRFKWRRSFGWNRMLNTCRSRKVRVNQSVYLSIIDNEDPWLIDVCVYRERGEDQQGEGTGDLQGEGESSTGSPSPESRDHKPLTFCCAVSVQKKKKYKKREQIEASTAGEAIEKMLEKKKISTKINYDVLRDLNKGTESPSTTPTDPPETATTRKRINRRRRRKTSEANQDLAADAIILRKRYHGYLHSVFWN